MPYKVSLTLTGRYALVASDGKTVHIYHSEDAAITARDCMNRSAYEPTTDAYAIPTPRWDAKKEKAA